MIKKIITDCAKENLSVVVKEDCYLLKYGIVAGGSYDNAMEIPFGFFATFSPTTIANKFNSASCHGAGFGIRESRRLMDIDILNNKEIQRLIAFDKEKMDNA